MKLLEDVLKGKCLSCRICCRFPEKDSPLIPFFMHDEITDEEYFPSIGRVYGCRIDLVKYNKIYACPYFNCDKNNCSKYDLRPLDCRLYPFMVTYNEDYNKVVLVLDNNCPYARDLIPFKDEAARIISSMRISTRDIGFINDPQPNTVFVNELPEWTDLIFGKDGRFRKLRLEDGLVMPYLWKDIVNILYEEDTGEAYYNFKRFPKENKDYIYLKQDLAELKGDRYKDKRNLCNYFQKNNDCKTELLVPDTGTIEECLTLYKTWAREKIKNAKTEYEKQLVEDSFFFNRRALLDYKELGLRGIILKIGGRIKGYTFGCAKDEKTFCVLAEITDRQYKGINQFLFREFCRIIPDNFIYVNVMDDSEIEGLKQNKKSYYPIKSL